jgi:hypothetical protein
MKPTLSICISLVLCGLAAGCATPNHPALAGEVTRTDLLIGDLAITSLGNTFTITAAAPSWPGLIQKTKPTFTWNNRDMLWIQAGEHGQPRFILDEAYPYQPASGASQWVLLGGLGNGGDSAQSGDESPRNFYYGQNLHAVMNLQTQVPPANNSGARGNYAVTMAIAGLSGIVYEIGWQREKGDGAAHPDYGRRIYVLCDNARQWHFLGEGPAEGARQGNGSVPKAGVIWDSSSATHASIAPVASHDYMLAGQTGR